jgi:hypothetical protein
MGADMSTDVIDRSDLTTERLLEVFREAYMSAELDEDGDIRIDEGMRVFVRLDRSGQRHIQLYTLMNAKDAVDFGVRLQFCNRFNNQWILVRAAASEESTLIMFDTYLWCDPILHKPTLVYTLKQFMRALPTFVQQSDADDILK